MTPEAGHEEAQKRPTPRKVRAFAVAAILVLASIGGTVGYYAYLNSQHEEARTLYTTTLATHRNAETELGRLISEAEELVADATAVKSNPMLIEEVGAAITEAKKLREAPGTIDPSTASTSEITTMRTKLETAIAEAIKTKSTLQEAYDKLFEDYNSSQLEIAYSALHNARIDALDTFGDAQNLLDDTKNKILDETTHTRLREKIGRLSRLKQKADTVEKGNARVFFNVAKEIQDAILPVRAAMAAVSESHAEWLKEYEPKRYE